MQALGNDMDWLIQVIDTRMAQGATGTSSTALPNPPVIIESDVSFYAEFVRQKDLSFRDRLLLITGLSQTIDPRAINELFLKGQLGKGENPEFGGVNGMNYQGFIPSGLTFIYLAAGNNRSERIKELDLLSGNKLINDGDVSFPDTKAGEPYISGPIEIETELLDNILKNGDASAYFSAP